MEKQQNLKMTNFDFVIKLPGLVIAKDINSTYLSISEEFAHLLGWQSARLSVGKTDYDIPCDAVEFADKFIDMDNQVLKTGQKMVAIDIQHYESGWSAVLVERNPLTDAENNVVGLFNHAIDISHTNMFKGCMLLNQLDNKILKLFNKPASYILDSNHDPLSLSKRQQECLFLLIRGKTVKCIAHILNLSERTVEDHVDVLKSKFNCYSKSQLIERAINSGFLYFIPEDLFKNNFINLISN